MANPVSVFGIHSYDPEGADHRQKIDAGPSIVGTTLLIGLVIVGGFIATGIWAATARISSAASAPGVVTVESHRKTIQHPQGGIVRSLSVVEGQLVRAGDLLIELDDTQVRSNVDALETQRIAEMVRLARLQAELQGDDKVVFPEPVLRRSDDPAVAELMIRQVEQFAARLNYHHSQIALLDQQIVQAQQQIEALEAQRRAIDSRIGLFNEELGAIKDLLDKGLERRPRYLELARQHTEALLLRAQTAGSVAQARQVITTSALQKADAENRRRAEITAERAEAQRQFADVTERLVAARDILDRTRITAQQDGYVVGLTAFTVGGVIQPGERIMDIVPKADDLVVEVQVKPADIDVVRVGLTAEVRLTAFKMRSTPAVKGEVVRVSADRVTDAQNNSFYSVRIRLDPADLSWLKDGELYPGMPADAMIITGERTVAAYLTSPIIDGLHDAFRED
jgi:HlyD family secretion protein